MTLAPKASAAPRTWHIITPEYPPDCGGVSDYSKSLAGGLRSSGDGVHVWCPGNPKDSEEWIHRLPGGMSVRGLTTLNAAISRFPDPHHLLVQWVPHGYGYRSMNLPVCLWLWWRACRGDNVEIMLHEAFLRFRQGNWKQDLAALVHRVMTIVLLQAASRVWMSTSSWEKQWRPYALGRRIPFAWLPVPTTIPVDREIDRVLELKHALAPRGKKLVGHFGTYGKNVAPALERIVLQLLPSCPDIVLLLVGRSSEVFRDRLIALQPSLASQIVASGQIDAGEISRHLSACDLLIQPFADGANARRTSLTAGLAHGAAVVTTIGRMTEPFWTSEQAVVAVPADREDLFVRETLRVLGDSAELTRLRKASRLLYDQSFALERGLSLLRGRTGTTLPL